VKLFCDEILGGLGRWLLAAGYNNSAPQEMAEQVPPASRAAVGLQPTGLSRGGQLRRCPECARLY
jgi:hypothetical protein